MPFKFVNPFTGLPDYYETSTGGGSEYPKVDTYAILSTDYPAAEHTDEIYFVRQTTGTWILGTQKKLGHYYSDGSTWTYAPNIDKTLSIKVGAVTLDNEPEVEFIAGTNVTLSASTENKTVTINATNYSLPTASESVKGGVKIGTGLSMNGEFLNATGSGSTSRNIDGGNARSVYLESQTIDGGGANG